MNARLLRALVVPILLSAVGVFVTPALAVQAGFGNPCSPGRADPYSPYWAWDGWDYPYDDSGNSSTVITGVWSKITTYDNVYSSSAPSSDLNYDWVMLTQPSTISGKPWAQIGYARGPYEDAWRQPQSSLYVQFRKSGTTYQWWGQQLTDSGGNPVESGSLSAGSQYWYTVLYDSSGGGFQFQFTLNGAPNPVTLYYNGIILGQNLGWIPYQAQANGETQYQPDQTFGDINTNDSFIGTQYAINGVGYDFNSGQISGQPYAEKASTYSTDPSNSSDFFPNTSAGYYEPTGNNSDLYIWDNGCPNSVNQYSDPPTGNGNTISATTVFDASGTGTNQTLESTGTQMNNGPYLLEEQTNGALDIWDRGGGSGSREIWLASGWSPSDFALMQSSDNLVLYNAYGRAALWSTPLGCGCYSNAYAVIQRDGNFVVYGTTSGPALWSSGSNWDSDGSGMPYQDVLQNGAALWSPNGDYQFVMQSDGNLVFYNQTTSPATVLWDSGTAGQGSNNHLCLQANGNLIIWNSANNDCYGTQEWTSNTANSGGENHLVVLNSGTVGWYTVDGGTVWSKS